LGKRIIVLDPFLDTGWNADFITNNQEKFLDVFWNNRECAVFIDEGSRMVGKYNHVMNDCATMGRHCGHKVFFITQRVKQLSTDVRTQCSDVAIFKQSLNDTKDLADEFVEPMINQAHTLSKGEFIYVRDGQKTLKLNVFNL